MSVTVIEKISYLLAEMSDTKQTDMTKTQDETISGVTCSGLLLPGNAYGTRLASDSNLVESKSEDRSVHFHNFFATPDIFQQNLL
jgi:hypothetical protein